MSVKDYLQGMPTEIATQFESQIVDSIPAPTVAPQTSAILHLYANGTNGSDLNDGLSAQTPKKTLRGVCKLIPYLVKHPCIVHLEGVFDLPAVSEAPVVTFSMGTSNESGSYSAVRGVIFDGGNNWETVAGPFTATSSGTTSIACSTAGLTEDQYMGYFIRIESGSLATQIRMIQRHDTTTLYPTANFSADPGLVQFSIIKPATKIRYNGLSRTIMDFAGCSGWVRFQRMFFDGCYLITRNPGLYVYFSHVLSDSYTVLAGTNYGVEMLGSIFNYYEPNTLALNTVNLAGLSFLNQNPDIRGPKQTAFMGMVCKGNMTIAQSDVMYALRYGSRIKGTLSFQFCRQVWGSGTAVINSDTGYATCRVYGNISISGSQLRIGQVIMENAGANAAAFYVWNNSAIEFLEPAPSGSTGQQFGMYIQGTNVTVTVGVSQLPTVTGTSGDISFDGTTQKSTWAALPSTPAVDANKHKLVTWPF